MLIAGSGPTDRDGNTGQLATPNTLRFLAEELAERGIASLRYDKRGVGESVRALGQPEDLTFDTFVQDAISWTQDVTARERVSCVFLLGHSEGALIAALVAQEVEVCGLISVAGAGRPIGEVLRSQLAALVQQGALTPALFERAVAILGSLEKGQRVDEVPAELAALFHPVLQAFLLSWMQHDPASVLAAMTEPVLILHGDTDLQVPVADAALMAAVNPRARFIQLHGVNHVLKVAPPDPPANLATYQNPELPLAPGVVDALVSFVAGHGVR